MTREEKVRRDPSLTRETITLRCAQVEREEGPMTNRERDTRGTLNTVLGGRTFCGAELILIWIQTNSNPKAAMIGTLKLCFLLLILHWTVFTSSNYCQHNVINITGPIKKYLIKQKHFVFDLVFCWREHCFGFICHVFSLSYPHHCFWKEALILNFQFNFYYNGMDAEHITSKQKQMDTLVQSQISKRASGFFCGMNWLWQHLLEELNVFVLHTERRKKKILQLQFCGWLRWDRS